MPAQHWAASSLSCFHSLIIHLSYVAGAGNMQALKVINMSGNALTGSLPINLTSLTRLQALDLASNQLTGKYCYQASKVCKQPANIKLACDGAQPTAAGAWLQPSMRDPLEPNNIEQGEVWLTSMLCVSCVADPVVPSVLDALGSLASLTRLNVANNSQLGGKCRKW